MSTTQQPQENPDVISDECLDASNEHADELFGSLTQSFDEMEEDGLDPIAVVYSLWVSFIYVLVNSGWSPEQLYKDLAHHANNNDVEGHG